MQQTSIAIYGRAFNSSVVPYVEQLFSYLKEKDVTVYIYSDFYDFLKGQLDCPDTFLRYYNHHDLPQNILFLLSLGGDGTMLSAVSQIRDSGIPIAGINFGRLGFLASIHKTKIIQALDNIFAGHYTLQARDLLEVSSDQQGIFGDANFALNDITVFRHDTSSMITINVSINGDALNSYWAAGVIIATTTRCTANALSCGGPSIIPGSVNCVSTPAAPHTLYVRTSVISADSELEMYIESRTDNYSLGCDCQNETLNTTTSVLIKA